MSMLNIKAELEQLDQVVLDTLGDDQPPGLSIGIVYQGEMVFERCFGYANIKQEIPVTADTVFRIGSISKTFTAVAIMQLWEQGLFKLDDPVNRYLKAFGIHPPNADAPPVTFHHLLSHTSGMGRGETMREFLDVLGHFTGWWEPRFETLNALYGSEGLRPMIAAGEKYSYSNNGYAILGQLVEDIRGQSFADYMCHHVFDPLGMMRSDVTMSGRVRPALAVGYKGHVGDYKPIRAVEIIQQGAGSMMCSLRDMAAFVTALLEQDERILRPDTWQLMFQPHWQLDPRLWTQAYGMAFHLVAGHRVYNQSGGAGGFNANLVFCPDHQIGLVALSNRNLTVETVLVTWNLLRHILGVAPPIPEAERAEVDDTAPGEQWKDLVGYYAPSPSWKTNIDFYADTGLAGVHVYIEDDKLMMRTDFGRLSDGVRLYPDADDPLLFYVRRKYEYPHIFERGANGQVDRLMFDYFHVLVRRPVTQSLKYRLKRLGWVSLGMILLILALRRMSKK